MPLDLGFFGGSMQHLAKDRKRLLRRTCRCKWIAHDADLVAGRKASGELGTELPMVVARSSLESTASEVKDAMIRGVFALVYDEIVDVDTFLLTFFDFAVQFGRLKFG